MIQKTYDYIIIGGGYCRYVNGMAVTETPALTEKF